MRSPNSTLGASGARAIEIRAQRKRAFEGPGKHIRDAAANRASKERLKREAEAQAWIEAVKRRTRND